MEFVFAMHIYYVLGPQNDLPIDPNYVGVGRRGLIKACL
jgi:hypothetical protein